MAVRWKGKYTARCIDCKYCNDVQYNPHGNCYKGCCGEHDGREVSAWVWRICGLFEQRDISETEAAERRFEAALRKHMDTSPYSTTIYKATIYFYRHHLLPVASVDEILSTDMEELLSRVHNDVYASTHARNTIIRCIKETAEEFADAAHA